MPSVVEHVPHLLALSWERPFSSWGLGMEGHP